MDSRLLILLFLPDICRQEGLLGSRSWHSRIKQGMEGFCRLHNRRQHHLRCQSCADDSLHFLLTHSASPPFLVCFRSQHCLRFSTKGFRFCLQAQSSLFFCRWIFYPAIKFYVWPLAFLLLFHFGYRLTLKKCSKFRDFHFHPIIFHYSSAQGKSQILGSL